ncbi:2-dehydro-3-deoxygluconokinase [Vibrio sp. WJH972]
MKQQRVAVIGECMVELQQHGELYKQSFGGDTLNTALYLSRLTYEKDVSTSYLTGLGLDPFSEEMLNQWKKENIDISMVLRSQTKLPGLYTIETQDDGERSFYYWRNDSAARFWLMEADLDALVTQLSTFDMIYLSGISLAILPLECLSSLIDVLQRCRDNGCKIAFDNNYRPKLWNSTEQAQQAYRQVLSLTDCAFLTFDDEVMLYGDDNEQQAIERTQQLGVTEIVVKRGADACFVVVDGEMHMVAANKISNVVDTTAAGDSFSAGYLAKRVTGGTPIESAQAGHLLAGTVIQYPGAIIPKEAMPHI